MTTTTPTTTSTTTAAATAQAAGVDGMQSLAGNFDTFLQLLTTQLQNQDPLDPLDTNQFTEQLVEFASVEQQVNMNTNLQTLISLQQTAEATSAMQFLGADVTINSNTGTLSNATGTPATWSFSSPSPASAAITISSSTGQVAYTGTTSLSAGTQSFTWNGQGNNGVTWPDGTYTLSITATGANGQPVTVSTQVQGVVTGINVSQNPPTVMVGGQSYPISAITSVNSASSSQFRL
jgi:flagellar basal-body rod modification protein FlgD